MNCWQNDPDARPTFTDLRNQLKDMETLQGETCDEPATLPSSIVKGKQP